MILIFFVSLIVLIKNKFYKNIMCALILISQLILDILFIFLYDSNGTVFEWAMFNQRTDAFGTLETFHLKWGSLILFLIIILLIKLI